MRRITLLFGLAAFLVPLSAFAHEGDSGHGPAASGSGSVSTEGAAGPEHAEGAEPEEKEPDWEASLDFVGGLTTMDVLNEGRPTRIELPPQNIFDSTRVTTLSFVPALERHFGPKLTVGLRIPIIDGELRSRTGAADPRTVLMAGNLELEGSYKFLARKNLDVFGVLEIALPTAGGAEPPTPDQVAETPTKSFDYQKIDRWATARGASFARGAFDSALFEPGRIGIIPKVTATLKAVGGKLEVKPTVKVENLIDVTGDAAQGYLGEFVGGVRVGYLVVPHVQPALSGWVSATFTSTDEKDTTFVVVEPAVKFPFERVAPEVGVIVPMPVGHLWDDKTWGLRLAIAGEF
ncbi:MAG TPA: hypothetical protein VIF62_06890 [Labilithrix sp.]|jgi:hypothetical protein